MTAAGGGAGATERRPRGRVTSAFTARRTGGAPASGGVPPVLVPDRPHPAATVLVIAAWLLQLVATG